LTPHAATPQFAHLPPHDIREHHRRDGFEVRVRRAALFVGAVSSPDRARLCRQASNADRIFESTSSRQTGLAN
jgi:hypothetical protein